MVVADLESSDVSSTRTSRQIPMPGRLASRRAGIAVALAVGIIVAWQVGSTFIQYLLGLMAIYAIVSLGQDLILGRAGIFTVGGAAIMGVGAYVTAWGSARGINVLLVLALSAVAGFVIGLMFGLPGIRFRGMYLVISTLALQALVTVVGEAIEDASGQVGGFSVKSPTLFGWRLTPGIPLLILAVVLAFAIAMLLEGVYASKIGRYWAAIREHDVAARGLGINVLKWKLAAFSASSAIVAVAGSLFAYYTYSVDYNTFTLALAVQLLVMNLLGGTRSILGAVVGAVIVTSLPDDIQQITQLIPSTGGLGSWLASHLSFINFGIYALLFLFVLLYLPDGLVGLGRRLWASRHTSNP